MKIILLQDVPKLGRKYAVVEASGGYALNFLIPKKMATLATPEAVAKIEQKKEEIAVNKEIEEKLLEKNLESLRDINLELEMKADDGGHLFASVHKRDIAEALYQKHRVTLDEKYIVLEKSIKQVGEFEIPVSAGNKKSSFKLIVRKEEN